MTLADIIARHPEFDRVRALVALVEILDINSEVSRNLTCHNWLIERRIRTEAALREALEAVEQLEAIMQAAETLTSLSSTVWSDEAQDAARHLTRLIADYHRPADPLAQFGEPELPRCEFTDETAEEDQPDEDGGN